MAKQRRGQSTDTGGRTTGEHRIEAFAKDLGRLLGTARARAEGWIGQREKIAQHLADIRDTASGLLAQLSGGKSGRRGRKPRVAGEMVAQPIGRRKRRKLSAEARARIAEAQRRRWAKQKAAERKNG